jgi:hypothetical protein
MDIDSKLEPLTVYNYDVSPAMGSLIRQVLKWIPDEYTKQFPSFSVFEAHSPWDAHVEDGKVFCDPNLLELPKDVAIGTLAHEFAHVFLGHMGESLAEDYEADDLACQWGFTKEVGAMREQFGPPIDH